MGIRRSRKRPSDQDQPQTGPQNACSPKHCGFSCTAQQTPRFPGPGLPTLTRTFAWGEGRWVRLSSSRALSSP